ncbi:hypothetical protein Cni_G24660 [Canna indica]|uniref:At4g15545-like C-terminal domain-containing protein n=1 Tax=Canna indica TaxID=4628 RepID=A0AAQ3KW64_9LILI|nr:hypothetical protein Cni_G24660 [Canna indica]
MSRNGAEFHLPDEILSVIPDDPYDQLDLARRITSMAITSRVSRLEAEAAHMRQKIADRDQLIDELQDKLSQLDRLVQESDSRLRATLKENAKLSKERDMLGMTSKKLSSELSKLETFKRHLMKSLSYDNLSQLSETVDIGTYKQPIARVSPWNDDGSISHFELDVANGSAETGDSTQDGSRDVVPQFSITSYSTAGSSPGSLSDTTSPTKSHFDEHASPLPLCAANQQISKPGSPPTKRYLPGGPGQSPRVDGKALFHQARTRLSYEQFAAFLAAVKEFNARKQSREETLAKTEEIFGTENKDLYFSFRSLLNRNQ